MLQEHNLNRALGAVFLFPGASVAAASPSSHLMQRVKFPLSIPTRCVSFLAIGLEKERSGTKKIRRLHVSTAPQRLPVLSACPLLLSMPRTLPPPRKRKCTRSKPKTLLFTPRRLRPSSKCPGQKKPRSQARFFILHWRETIATSVFAGLSPPLAFQVRAAAYGSSASQEQWMTWSRSTRMNFPDGWDRIS